VLDVREALSLASMTVAAGYADNVIAEASSHYGSAEKQFRFPLEYGNQRPLSATWTVTGSGAFVVSDRESDVCIQGVTTGQIVDYGVKDSLNMGACMAPAAAAVIYQNLQDFGIKPTYYDRIITGDLGKVGKTILEDLAIELRENVADRRNMPGVKVKTVVNEDRSIKTTTITVLDEIGCFHSYTAAYQEQRVQRRTE
jgi:stage V sporulation protein AD